MKKLLLTTLLLLFPILAFGDIAYDTAGGANLSGTTVTISLAVANQANRMLVVGVSSEGNSAALLTLIQITILEQTQPQQQVKLVEAGNQAFKI